MVVLGLAWFAESPPHSSLFDRLGSWSWAPTEPAFPNLWLLTAGHLLLVTCDEYRRPVPAMDGHFSNILEVKLWPFDWWTMNAKSRKAYNNGQRWYFLSSNLDPIISSFWITNQWPHMTLEKLLRSCSSVWMKVYPEVTWMLSQVHFDCSFEEFGAAFFFLEFKAFMLGDFPTPQVLFNEFYPECHPQHTMSSRV